MGERFYNRQDVHMLDWKYLHTDGQGGGIENINLGFGKLAYAYMVSDGAAKGNLTPTQPVGARDNMALHQLKLDDIDVNPGGKLYFAVEFDSAQPYTGPSSQVPVAGSYNNYVSNSSNNKGGASIIVMHTQSVLNGANHLVFQYATGAAEGLGNGDQFGRSLGSLGSGNKATRVIDEISGQPTKNFGFEAVAAYESDKLDSGTGMTANGSWATVGFRPKIGITDHFSIEGEFGWEKTTLDNNAYTVGTEAAPGLYYALVAANGVAPVGNRTLTKETIALEWSPTTEFWSRPSMRLFYTNASWNKQAQGSVGGGGSAQSSAFVFADKTSGSQYGVQTEVWF
jgi:maltoporin